MGHDELLQRIRTRLIDGMREYMEHAHGAYNASHIAECDAILVAHVAAVRGAGDRDVALARVRETVLLLNALNGRCGGSLIETDQREDICAFIPRGGYLCGFNGEDEDVTEEWREW
jgi:hypothetical protein